MSEWTYRKHADGTWWAVSYLEGTPSLKGIPALAVGPISDADRMDNTAKYTARKYQTPLKEQCINAAVLCSCS